MKLRIFLTILCLLVATGCEKSKEAPPSPQAEPAHEIPAPDLSTVPLLKAPVKPLAVEYPTQALSLWRQYRSARPALVLVSGDPFLQPLPQEVREEAVHAIRTAPEEELGSRVAFPRPDPLLLPAMAVSAALRAGLFSEILWVYPSTAAPDEINPETFRGQLLDFGAVTEEEAKTFVLKDGVITGEVSGTPFRAAHPAALPPLEGPAVVHIDLSYFAPLYKGEIKTPLYPLVLQNLALFRNAGWETLAASLSRSNVEGRIPVSSRFLGDDLAALLSDPALFDAPMPESWSRRANALYLENFFQKEKIRDLYLEMEKAAPGDPSVKYALYGITRQFKEGTKALEYLAEAAAIDPAYALEYLSLADLALEKQLPHETLRMLQSASEAFPENPFIRLRIAELLRSLGQGEEAERIVKEMRELPWSAVYYPEMGEVLKNWSTAKEGSEKGKSG